MKLKTLWTLLLTFMLTALPTAQACVGCRAPGEKSDQLTVTAGVALSWSVLFMLVFIGCALAFLGWYIARYCSQLSAEHAQVLRDEE